MKGFYSPIDKLAAELPRTKGTGAEFMTELSKRPGYKPQEAQDRDLQALMAMPKMAREDFLAQLKAKPAPKLEDTVLDNTGASTKYNQWTLPGGTNYREILMRMPPDEQRAKEFSDPASSHWDTPNVLAHVRAKDRTGPNGEKLLHIEEIQSDWHQKGREHGYATPESLKEFRAVELRHKLLKQKLDEAKAQSESAENSLKRKEPLFQQPDVRERYEAARVRANNDIMDLMPQVMKAQAEVQDFGHKMNSMVPNAPFKKNWHELALKKMIHHAAEQGYHGLVITPGEEQAKRYDLSKHVGMVSYHPEQQRFQAFKPNRETVINEAGATPERVAELIGKDAAARLMDAPQNMGHHYLEGENLRVGGEGMKGFYDKIVPSFLNQFGKKYGAKVGTLPITGPNEEPWGIGDAANFHGMSSSEYLDHPNRAQLEKQFLQARNTKATPVHHFPITPEMREDVTKNGVPLYAKGGAVEDDGNVPKKTVKAYKMFRADKKQPGKLFPLFVDSNTPVEMDKWITAKEGEKSTTNTKKVKSKIGDLAYRPGWHAGDLPIATHIGDKDEEQKAEARRIRELRDAHAAALGNTKAAKAIARKEHPYPSWVNAPRLRNPNHIWAEVEMPDDVDWQSEATKRGYNDQGKLIASQAHITDQLPLGGHYRYKTNSNMLGNWLIGGSMKVNRILHDKEVEAINKAAGAADLPRAKAMNQKAFGFAEGGIVGPEEWMAEEHVNHKAKSGALPKHERDANLAKMLEGSKVKDKLYHGTHATERGGEALRTLSGDDAPYRGGIQTFLSTSPKFASSYAEGIGGNVLPVHAQIKNPFDFRDKFAHFDARDFYRDNGGIDEFDADKIREGLKLKPGGKLTEAQFVRAVKKGHWPALEAHEFVEWLAGQGHDAVVTKEGNAINYGIFDPRKIKSAIGNRGTYDTNEADMTKAKGGSIKPVGYTKEKVTVSPSLDQMRYELISVKHSKKAK